MRTELAERFAAIQEKVAEALKRSGRTGKVEIVAVSKTQPLEVIQAAMSAGILRFGENKVQEAKAKIDVLERGVWHLIGHLQTNKARDAVRLFHSIDSVDRLDLAQEINQRALTMGKTQNVLLQVNVSGEGTKFGCAPGDALTLAEQINAMGRLTLNGLMTIAPVAVEPEKVRPVFVRLRELRDEIEAKTGLKLPDLSMGMSGDYLVAVEEGSTAVRIGSALFGARGYTKA